VTTREESRAVKHDLTNGTAVKASAIFRKAPLCAVGVFYPDAYTSAEQAEPRGHAYAIVASGGAIERRKNRPKVWISDLGKRGSPML
jgi:hypothetical protein